MIIFPHEVAAESDSDNFLKPIDSSEPQTAVNNFTESEKSFASPVKTRFDWSPRYTTVLLIGFAAAGLALAFGINRFSAGKNQTHQNSIFQNISFKKVVGSDGGYSPTISPDGKTTAYRDENTAIWIENLANGSRMQLKDEDEPVKGIWLKFSPDGNYLYYVKTQTGEPNTIYQIAVPNGTPRKVVADSWTGAAVSPDGKRIAFARMNVGAGEYSLLTINTDGSGERRIAAHRIPNFFSLYGNTLAWSPDGREIACIGYAPDYQAGDSQHVLTINVDDGSEFAVPNPDWQTKDFDELAWRPDGNGLLVTARNSFDSPAQIWQVAYPSGEWSRITNDLNKYAGVDASADGKTLITAQDKYYSQLWLVPSDNSSRARQITFGQSNTDGGGGVAFTPDGKSIVYVSNAGGRNEIWKANSDGSNPRQITFGNESTGFVNVTPDNRYIVYTAKNNGKLHLWRVSLDGDNPTQLTEGIGGGEWQPAVTPDSRYVIYTAETAPASTLWRVSIDGGEAVQLTEKYQASMPVISPDGKWIAHGFYNEQSKSPWQTAVTPIGGGNPIKLFDLEAFRGVVRWTQVVENNGATFETQTRDLSITNRMLYQLS